jgi:hypothetical protein
LISFSLRDFVPQPEHLFRMGIFLNQEICLQFALDVYLSYEINGFAQVAPSKNSVGKEGAKAGFSA